MREYVLTDKQQEALLDFLDYGDLFHMVATLPKIVDVPRRDAGSSQAETRVEYLAKRWEEIASDMMKERDQWRSKFESEYLKHQETYKDLVYLRSLRKLQTP